MSLSHSITPTFLGQDWFDTEKSRPAKDSQSGRFMAYVRLHARRVEWGARVAGSDLVKRSFDIVAAVILMVLIAPTVLIVASLIRAGSPGAVVFKQVRIGKYGKPFTFWKLRSMYADAEARKAELVSKNEVAGGILFKMKRDPRITPIGRFIRKTSIDELPQLWNVLIGDMSLVGPRPALPHEVREYSLNDRQRLDAAPGITCFWQASGRSDIAFPQQVELDVKYVHSQSLLLDLRILLQTIPAVLLGRGAY